MKNISSDIPNKIWILWLQGLEKSPEIVKHCYNSWKRLNPEWEIILLTEDNLNQYVEVDLPNKKIEKLTPNGYANLIRLKLLIQYGGVWVDATTFCMNPLNDWLLKNMGSGFFAFRKPGPDREMSNWFLASEKNNYIVSHLYRNLISYWGDNNLSNKHKGPLVAPFDYFLNKNTRLTRYWFSPFITKILRIHPYFNFHYMFSKLLEEDERFAQLWSITPSISASIPHRVLHSKMLQPISDVIKREIDNNEAPLYKLSWKYPVNDYREGCTLHYLLKPKGEYQ